MPSPFVVRCLARLRLAAACGAVLLPALAVAAPPSPLATLARRHAECAAPAFLADEAVVTEGFGGFNLQVGGESHWIALKEHRTQTLQSRDGSETLAQIKLEQPAPEEFEEQVAWRTRSLEQVAHSAGVPAEVRPLPGNSKLIVLSKQALKGKFAGITLMVDAQRRSIIEWDWDILPRYTGMADAVATQTAVWKQLLPCILRDKP